MLSMAWLIFIIDIATKLLLDEAVLTCVGHRASDNELFTLLLSLELPLLAILRIIAISPVLKSLDLKVLGFLSDLFKIVTRVALLSTAETISILAILELNRIVCSILNSVIVTELLLVSIRRTVEAILASAATTHVLDFWLLLAILKVILASALGEL